MREQEEQKKNLTRVIPFELSQDEVGDFIGYCFFYKHIRVIGRERIKRCLERNCEYSRIFREERRRYRR